MIQGGNLNGMPRGYVRAQQGDSPRSIKESPHLLDNVWDVVDVLEEQGIKVSTPLLVLGCNSGYECRQFRRLLEGRIVGVDIAPRLIQKALLIARAQKLDLEFRIADMHKLPFKGLEFNFVYCRGTLEHMYNLERAVAQIKRVAAQYVFITADLVPKRIGADYAFSEDPEDWKALFEGPEWALVHEWLEDSYRGNLILQMVWKREELLRAA